MNRNIIKKSLFIVIGSISLALGVIGIVVPILPTTPFLLLSCFCYLRSSKRLYDRLMQHRVFGKYIYNYVTYRAITIKAKVISMVWLWTSLIISMIFVANLHTRLILAVVGIGVTVHFLVMRTIRDEDISSENMTKENGMHKDVSIQKGSEDVCVE